MARRLRSRRFSGAGLNNTPYTSDIIQKNEDMLGELNLLRISSVVMAAYLMAAYAMSGSWVEWRVYIKGVPTVVFLDSRGKERRDLRLADFLPADQFLDRP